MRKEKKWSLWVLSDWDFDEYCPDVKLSLKEKTRVANLMSRFCGEVMSGENWDEALKEYCLHVLAERKNKHGGD